MSAPLPEPTRRNPIAFMAGHSVAANLIMAVFLVGGLLALRNIKQEFFPEIELDMVSVAVAYPGASPEEVESGILLSIEEAVRELDGVDEVTSVAREGSGTVNVELLSGADTRTLVQEVESEVNRITTFPDEAEEPEIRIASRKRGVCTVVVHGDVPLRVLHQLGELVRDQLLQDPDVTQVELEGLPPPEIAVEISQNNLRRYGLTLQQVSRALASASIDLPGGALKTDRGEILLRVKERRDYGQEFARLPLITAADGTEVLLEDVATVMDGYEDTDRMSFYDGDSAAVLDVYRVGDQTPISVSKAVLQQLETTAEELPPGIGVSVINNRADNYRQRVFLLCKNGAIGLVLVMVVLGLFLEARLAFWVMLGIPISFLGSFLFLPMGDVTINMISLFAYIIALGIVVDDAIVVGENVYHYHQEGLSFIAAATRGAREVAMPVTFSILTNIVTFIPMYFVPGTMGRIFRMIPVVVIIVFLISLGESLFILPAHLGHQKDRRRRRGAASWLHHRQQAFSHWFRNWVRTRYGPFLRWVLGHRYITIAGAVSLLILALGFAGSGRMGMQLFPVIESDYADARLVLPYGSPVARTKAITDRIVAGARQVIADAGNPELVESILVDIGQGGGHTARVKVGLVDADERERLGMSTQEFANAWRRAVGEVVGVENIRFAADSGGPGSHGRPLTVELSHRRMEILQEASRELAAIIATYPRVKDVDDGFQPGKEQLDFSLTPEGKSLGLSARDIALQVRHAFYGAEVVRQQRGRNEIKVMVRLPKEERASEHTIHDLLVRTPAGTYVPFREVARTSRGRAYTTIDRRQGRRVVQVAADVTPRNKAGEVLFALRSKALRDLVSRHRGLTYSFEGHQADMRESMSSLKGNFLYAILAIFVLLAIPFRSYLQPLIVMMSIPFGIVGAILGHLVMGYSLCIPSMFGIVALSGVVVNDSLVMVDFANRLRAAGDLTALEAVHRAAIQRFRPILLTTITTFGGLAPMIFETSRQAKFLIPMAISLGFGILFATLITLVLVPSLYVTIEDAQNNIRSFRGWWRRD